MEEFMVIPSALWLGVLAFNWLNSFSKKDWRSLNWPSWFMISDRAPWIFADAGFPHLNQSACRMFWCYLCIPRNDREVHESRLHSAHVPPRHLQKAFDSVEFPVLLDHLFSIGINGKTWRLIRNWYKGGTCSVQVDGAISSPFSIERGIRQGSVLSPTLFNIVMDPLLKSLESSGLGLCINGLYGGAYLHANDVRTLSASISSLRAQINLVLNFANRNTLS